MQLPKFGCYRKIKWRAIDVYPGFGRRCREDRSTFRNPPASEKPELRIAGCGVETSMSGVEHGDRDVEG